MTDDRSPTTGDNGRAPSGGLSPSYSSSHSTPRYSDIGEPATAPNNQMNAHENGTRSTDNLQNNAEYRGVRPVTSTPHAFLSAPSDSQGHFIHTPPLQPPGQQSTNAASHQVPLQSAHKKRKSSLKLNMSNVPPSSTSQKDNIASMQTSIQDLYTLQNGNIMFMNNTVAAIQELKRLLKEKETQNQQLHQHHERLLLKHEELLERHVNQAQELDNLREGMRKEQQLLQQQLLELHEQTLQLKNKQYQPQTQSVGTPGVSESVFLAQLEELTEREIADGNLDNSQLAIRKEKLKYVRLLLEIGQFSTVQEIRAPEVVNDEWVGPEYPDNVSESVIMEERPGSANVSGFPLLRRKYVLNIKRYCTQRERSILKTNEVLRALVASEVEGLRDWYLVQPGRFEGGDSKQRLLEELRDKMYALKRTYFPPEQELAPPEVPGSELSNPDVTIADAPAEPTGTERPGSDVPDRNSSVSGIPVADAPNAKPTNSESTGAGVPGHNAPSSVSVPGLPGAVPDHNTPAPRTSVPDALGAAPDHDTSTLRTSIPAVPGAVPGAVPDHNASAPGVPIPDSTTLGPSLSGGSEQPSDATVSPRNVSSSAPQAATPLNSTLGVAKSDAGMVARPGSGSFNIKANNWRIHFSPEEITVLDNIFEKIPPFREKFQKDIEQLYDWYNNQPTRNSDTKIKQALLGELAEKLHEVKNKLIADAAFQRDFRSEEEYAMRQKHREAHKLKRTSPHPYEDSAVPFPVMPLNSI